MKGLSLAPVATACATLICFLPSSSMGVQTGNENGNQATVFPK
jgi:hypothetical protein